MSKAVTFEFEGKQFSIPKELVEQYEREIHRFDSLERESHHELMDGPINPFRGVNNPYDEIFMVEDWYRRELKGIEWFGAASDALRKYAFGWRWFFKPWWKGLFVFLYLGIIACVIGTVIAQFFN